MSALAYSEVAVSEPEFTVINPGQTTAAVLNISWSNVNFYVGTKGILTDCWGNVEQGQVCAILGPSGAGKSSLLNVLAGRSATSKNIVVDGIVKVDGKTINPVKYRRNIAYVMQNDALMATATPREAIMFSANMRLPSDTPKDKLLELVDKLLNDLGIMECADLFIGNALIKGISGGQRKRTSVGVEVVSDPKLLFLDEPTTGLDSHSASNLIHLLKIIAAKNSAILCTIHQPSSEVFALFDVVIFMKAGRIFYQGPVSRINTYYAEHDRRIPENFNPADFVMNLSQVLAGDELEKLFFPIPDYALLEKESSQRRGESHLEFQVQSSFLKQLLNLSWREAVATRRDTTALATRFSVAILLNLLYGLIFLGVGGKDNGNNTNFSNHLGGLILAMLSCMFGTATPVMLAFPFERPMYLREVATGTYTTSAYVIGKLVVEIPLTIVQMFVVWLLAYFMMDLQGNYFQLVGAGFGLAMTSNSLAVMLSSAISDVKDVSELSPLVFVPQMLFAGFFVRLSQIPIFLRWAQYLCGMSYGVKLAFQIEFDPSLESCRSSAAAAANCSGLLSSNGINVNHFWVQIVCSFAIFFVARFISGCILEFNAKSFQ